MEARLAAPEDVDARVIVHARRELGAIVIDRHAEERGVDLEGLDEVESEPAGEKILVIAVTIAMCGAGNL
jgi:hypothetical protein